MSFLLWAIVLMIASLAFVILEASLPSAGLLSVLAAVSLVASIAMAFCEGVGTGVTFLAIAAIGLPIVAAAMLKFWPHTPIGRLVLLSLPEDQDDVLPETEEYRGLKSLIGKQGIARTKMLPSGAVAIDNRVFDALSQGVSIEPGQLVEVIGVEMGHIVVAPLDESDLANAPAASGDSREANPLARPLEEFGLNDLEEPLNS